MIGINQAIFEQTERELLMYIPAAISAYYNVLTCKFFICAPRL